MNISRVLAYTIVVLGMLNLFHLAIYMISSDIYELNEIFRRRKAKQQNPYQPFITVIIPAYNEELCIERTMHSVLANDYKNMQLVVVNDGSADKTLELSCKVAIESRNRHVVKVVTQDNQGKASAINNALHNHLKGSLVMVLDADSILRPDAISKMVSHFANPEVVAAAANVKVIDNYKLLNIAQRLEYVISHRMKRALTTLNMEYIIGGVGSTFRRNIVKAVEYYDTDTMTEDIDFTMKIINRQGNKHNRVIFAADVITYTEGVMTFGALVKQRFRWKYGRMQTFVKNRSIFFSRDEKHTKQLAWLNLPYILFSELMLLFEPIFTGFVIYTSIRYAGVAGFAATYVFVSGFSLVNIIAESTESIKNKITLVSYIPLAYPLLMLMSLVDFFALLKSLRRFPDILRGRNQVSHWTSPERSGIATEVSL